MKTYTAFFVLILSITALPFTSSYAADTIDELTFKIVKYSETVPVPQAYQDKYPQDSIIREVQYPQIISPQTKGQELWNKRIKDDTSIIENCEGRPGSVSSTYSIEYASPDFISLKILFWQYCLGAAHGYGTPYYRNYFLSDLDKELQFEDLFEENSGWKGALLKLANQNLEGRNAHFPINEKRLSSPKGWRISAEGIAIPYGRVNGYAQGLYYSKIPWESLAPYLKKDSLFPPDQDKQTP